MAEMTMISMAVMAATQQSRSFLEAAAGRKGPVSGGRPSGGRNFGDRHSGDRNSGDRHSGESRRHISSGLQQSGFPAGAQTSEGRKTRSVSEPWGAADAGSLKALAQTADEHGAVLLDHIHLAFNPCMASLKTALTCLGPIWADSSPFLWSMPSAVRGYAFLLSVPACVPPGGCIVSEGRRLPLSPLCISSAYRNRWMPRWCSRNMEWTQPALSGDIWAPPEWR